MASKQHVLNYANFRLFLIYRFFMTCATLMMSVVVGWQVYSLTKDVLALGLIGLVEVIPQVSVALFAGHYVDVLNRKKIVLFTTLLLLVGSAFLYFYSVPEYNMYSIFGIFPIYATVFLTGFVRGVLMPAHVALLGEMVPRDLLTQAATWNSANWHIAAVVGPALGGLIYGFFSPAISYATVFAVYFIAIVCIFFIKYQFIPPLIKKTEGIIESIQEGIRFVLKNQVLWGAFSLDMFAVLFGGAVALLPVFASDILHVGPQGLGFLRACPAVGAIIMAIILIIYPPVRNSGKLMFLGVGVFGLSIIAFALSKNIYLSAFILLISGAADNVSVVVRQSILQLFTPNEMRGRVAAVNSIFIGSSNELGAFESGLAARLMGVIPSVIFGGGMTMLITLFGLKYAPKLRKMELKDLM